MGEFKIVISSDITLSNIQYVIAIQNRIITGNENTFIIYFTDAKYLDAAISVLIGTLPIYASKLNKKVLIRFRDNDNPIFKFIKKVGIYDYFSNSKVSKYISQKAIPFGKITDENMMEIYTDKIIKLAPIQLDDEASEILSVPFFEIYQNCFIHAESDVGVFSCGYWMPDELVFSIYDMGIGIPCNIRNHLGVSKSSEECIRWAFEKGTTTQVEGLIKRGLGLDTLRKFIYLNNGSMLLYTNDAYYTINNGKEEMGVLNVPIQGTLFIIRIKADPDNIYVVDREE